MRAGFTPALEERLRRADPSAHLIVEAAVVEAEDTRKRRDQWQAADSLLGLETLTDGGVRLAGVDRTPVDNPNDDGIYITDLSHTSPLSVARIEWGGPEAAGIEIREVVCRLIAQRDGLQPSTVAYWKLQLYNLVEVVDPGTFTARFALSPISEPVTVPATGTTTPSDVAFSFAHLGVRPRPKDVGPPIGGGTTYRHPITYVVVWAVRSDGATPADNVGWAAANAVSVATGGNLLSGRRLTAWDDGGYREEQLAVTPRMRVLTGGYSRATLAFTGGGNRIDLGSTPTADVELVGQGDIPAGTSITFEVSADGVTWYPYRDGDLVGHDNTVQGGHDLSTLPVQQTYRIRATLDPNPSGEVTPTLRALGARAVMTRSFDGLARVEGGTWAIDPLTLKGEITETAVTVLIDGERDYRSAIEDLLVLYDLAAITLRLWVGDEDLSRADWLLIDEFDIDDYEAVPGGIRLICLSALARVRAALPPYNAATQKREPIAYENDSLADVYADLLDSRIGLPARYRGQGVTDTTTVSKVITDGEAKDELDAIAYLAGGGVIASQGRVKFVQMHDLGGVAPVRIFPSEEIRQVGITPGYRYRVEEFFVPWSWSDTEGRYRQERRVVSAAGLLAFGVGRVDAPRTPGDIVSRWIDAEMLAEAVGLRVVRTMGTGLVLWSFESVYPYPELEPGDRVVVQTDKFVARDPTSGRILRGALWALAVVQAVHDPMGRVFTVWVQSLADVGAVPEAVTRAGFAVPEVLSLVASADQGSGAVGAVVRCRHARSVRIAARTDREPTREEVRSAPVRALTADGNLSASLGVTVAPDGPVYVAALAYEMPDGGGAESTDLAAATTKRIVPTQLLLRVRLLSSAGGSLTYRVAVGDPLFASGTGNVTIAWTETGTGGVSPTSPRTIAAGNLRDTPAASEAAGGYVDFTVDRPASGAGNGRVVFEATRADRIGVTQSVDVPELPPNVPVQALPPLCDLEVTVLGPANATIEVTGVARTGGTTPTQYARREYALGATPPAWGSWQNLTNGEAAYSVARGTGSFVIAEAKVRDAQGRESAVARVEIEPAGMARHGESITNFTDRYAANIVRSAVDPIPLSQVTQLLTDEGNLAQGMQQFDGVGLRGLVRGYQEFFVEDGEGVTFDPPFQDIPAVIIQGPMGSSGSLSGDQFRYEVADGLTPSGITHVRLKLYTITNPTAESDFFPAGTLSSQGAWLALPSGLSEAASDSRYYTRYAVNLSATAFANRGDSVKITLKVAVDTKKLSDPNWTQRGAKQYSVLAANGQTDSLNLTDEVIEFATSALGAGDDVRVVIELLDVDFTGNGGTYSVSVDPSRVSYTTFTPQYATQTPIGSNQVGRVIAFGAY